MVVTFSVPLSIVTRLEIDTVDLDSFLAKPADGQKKPPATAPATTAARPAAPGPSLGLKLKVTRAIYNKETIGGIEVDLAIKGRTLELNDIKVSNLVGARLAVRGNVSDYDSALPRADIAFNFEAPDMSRVLNLAGATAPTDIGLVTASGGVSGTVEALTFRELGLRRQGQSAQIDGTLAMPGAAQAARPRPSATRARSRPRARPSKARSTPKSRPAQHHRRSQDHAARSRQAGRSRLPRRPPRGVLGRRPPRPRSPAIDTSAMRAFDASLKLAPERWSAPPLRLNNADIALTLKDGVLTLQHLKGGLYGGTLDLSGDRRRPQARARLRFQGRRQRHQSRRDAARHRPAPTCSAAR